MIDKETAATPAEPDTDEGTEVWPDEHGHRPVRRWEARGFPVRDNQDVILSVLDDGRWCVEHIAVPADYLAYPTREAAERAARRLMESTGRDWVEVEPPALAPLEPAVPRRLGALRR